MVTLIAGAADEHALMVKRILEQRHGEPAFLLDFSRFPVSASLEGRLGGAPMAFRYVETGAAGVDLHSATSFWWRRPQAPSLDPRITDLQARNFAYSECLSALHGMLACCDGLWMNDIHADDAADYKPRQLKSAAQAGFTVPDTVITNDPEAAREFWRRHEGKVVYKPFNQRAISWRPARQLTPDDLGMLHQVRTAPVIFQELVPGTRDIRVTMVGHQVFAAEFVIPAGGEIDYRLHLADAPCTRHELPADVERCAHALLAGLGLEYGAIDLRRRPDGSYVFFELNTGGEFLFVQQRTGQPIADAVAAHLAAGVSAHLSAGSC